jgi:hypothetical protein
VDSARACTCAGVHPCKAIILDEGVCSRGFYIYIGVDLLLRYGCLIG